MPSLACSLITCLFITSALSHPTISHRHHHRQRWEPTSTTPAKRDAGTFDLDANGVPDVCDTVNGNQEKCKEANGQWTTFDPNSPPTPTANAVALSPVALPAATGLAGLPKGKLPSAKDFQAQNGTKDASGKGWSITKKGVLGYSGPLGQKTVNADKARTGMLAGQVIWNFGDMMCSPDYTVCGFDKGPAFYGTSDILQVNTAGIELVQEAGFIQPHTSVTDFFANEVLGDGCRDWGMDNSNVAALNDTHGIVYSWEIWRSCPTLDGKNDGYKDRGLAASVITIGDKLPKAERISGILAGADRVAAGLVGIMNAEGYVYSYTVETQNGVNNMIVGRAKADNPLIFSSDQAHEFYVPATNTWTQGIPLKADAAKYNLVTAQPGGWNCGVYGSVMYSNYFNKYMLFCDMWMNEFNFYTSDTPAGPWSEQYQLLKGFPGYYGAHVHQEYSENGSHKGLYISMGPNSFFDVWRVEFDYDI